MTKPLDTLDPFRLALARHLPPSSSLLRLADAGGGAGEALAELRDDLDVQEVDGAIGLAALPEASVDAITWLGALDGVLMAQALRALRAGGRFIAVNPTGAPTADLAATLEDAGFVRVLVEAALFEPARQGVLMRGERPHTTADTLARVDRVAATDAALTDWTTFRGRYVHLLVHMTPNKPLWALSPGEHVVWQAAALNRDAGPALLAFSSLPNAVAFLQQAVLAGVIEGVNKVAKFPRTVAETWSCPLLFNPPLEAVAGESLVNISINPAEAATGEE